MREQAVRLRDPRAWLETAYHEVLTAAGWHSGNDLNKVITAAWQPAIDPKYQKPRTYPHRQSDLAS